VTPVAGVTPAANRTPVAGPSDAQIAAAVAKLKSDPNLVSQRKMRTLRWVGESTSVERPDTEPTWMQWLEGLFEWLGQSARLLVWAACVVFVGILAVYLTRLARERNRDRAAPAFVAPTHVRDLDIRPESLPEDIGAASLELWRRAEHRAALALLYRGCLSRLAHVHSVPIRDSTTEGECVLLAMGHLSSGTADYVSQLVRIWQRAVYRGDEPSAEAVASLCDGFRSALDSPPSPQAAGLAA